MKVNPLKNIVLLGIAMIGAALSSATRAETTTVPAAVPAPVTSVTPDYRIGPGDTLKVSVFQNED